MKMRHQLPIELLFWITALVILASNKLPDQPAQHHFSMCPLANLGFSWCPGCGIGRSITALLHGDFNTSFQLHWFGIPALLILMYRICILIRSHFHKSYKVNLERKDKNYV